MDTNLFLALSAPLGHPLGYLPIDTKNPLASFLRPTRGLSITSTAYPSFQ